MRALRRPAAARAGFTILELLVLLAILSIVASIGIPAYFARPEVTLDSAAKLLARDLREVQNRAALYEEPLQLRFLDDGAGYEALDARGESLISPYGKGPFLRCYDADAVFRGVEITTVRAGHGGRIRFDERGRPETSARVIVSFADESRTVFLRAGSGLIAIDGLEEPWVDLGL
ncbi:MAG: GspH/FimT family protein [Planctomycetota bacterium]